MKHTPHTFDIDGSEHQLPQGETGAAKHAGMNYPYLKYDLKRRFQVANQTENIRSDIDTFSEIFYF